MKKLISMILAVILVLALACTAMADEDDGAKFDTFWAIEDAIVEIDQEEEGFRVLIIARDYEEGRGTIWEYNCFYMEDVDALVSMTNIKRGFTFNPEYPDDETYEEPEREGFDDEGKTTMFMINENGNLIWEDGYENMGQDLEFINIGRYGGSWMNEEAAVYTVITWNGHDGDFYYDVYLQEGNSDADTYTIYYLVGMFNEETGKLECAGPAVTYTSGEDGGVTDGELYEAIFSWSENGNLLLEAGDGIELEEDFGNNG